MVRAWHGGRATGAQGTGRADIGRSPDTAEIGLYRCNSDIDPDRGGGDGGQRTQQGARRAADPPGRLDRGGRRRDAAAQRVADIPDVVVGPGGVFVVSAQAWDGEAAVVDGVLTLDGCPRTADTETCLDSR